VNEYVLKWRQQSIRLRMNINASTLLPRRARNDVLIIDIPVRKKGKCNIDMGERERAKVTTLFFIFYKLKKLK